MMVNNSNKKKNINMEKNKWCTIQLFTTVPLKKTLKISFIARETPQGIF